MKSLGQSAVGGGGVGGAYVVIAARTATVVGGLSGRGRRGGDRRGRLSA